MSWMSSLTEPARSVSLAFALLVAACSTQAGSEPTQVQPSVQDSVHPVSGLDIIVVKVRSQGETHSFRAELALTPAERARGLMFREELGENEGMFFLFFRPQFLSFWMRNTPLSLDIIFIGPDRRILNIAAYTVPYSLDSIPSVAPGIAVLELRGGRAAELGIAPGDLVEW